MILLYSIHSLNPIIFVIPLLDKISCGFNVTVDGNLKFLVDLILQLKVHYLLLLFIIFLWLFIQIIDKFNICVVLILEFL